MKLFIYSVLLLATLAGNAGAWASAELEIFDLVQEINTNFNEFMYIGQDATNTVIKRAFRNLSIILHPDKNSAEDANIQFRNLVSIYEVLKDRSKREKHKKVLKESLPNWKSAWYYRRMPNIDLYEGGLMLFIIITIGQYMDIGGLFGKKVYSGRLWHFKIVLVFFILLGFCYFRNKSLAAN